jgi:chromosome segregation ATPase
MAMALRSLLSRSRSRALFPVMARFDELGRRFDALERRFDELSARLDRLTDQQAGFAGMLQDVHLEALRQQGRLGAVEERAAALLAEQEADARRLDELGRLLR